jgi:hypothetical protein
MTPHRLLLMYLWIAPHLLQGALAILLVSRKLARQFPAFFLYTVFEVAQFLILFVLNQRDDVSGPQYTSVWIACNAVSVVLRFAVVHEVFNHLFRSYPAFTAVGTILFRCATVVLMIVAVVLVAYTAGSETDSLIVAITVVDRAVSIVQCGLLILLLLLSRFLNVSWNSYAFGITLGLGLFASVELGTSAIRTYLGLAVAKDFFDIVTMATYHCCVVLWIVALFVPERAPGRLTSIPAHNLEQWNEALQRLL